MVQEEDALFKKRRTGNIEKQKQSSGSYPVLCVRVVPTGTLLKEVVLGMQDEIQDTSTRGWFTTRIL